ncbi:MAG: hypothetical protein ABI597_06740 [Gammaproteobacteria bacterium]
MNTRISLRMFQQHLPRQLNNNRRFISNVNSQPPILLLAEDHSRPAAYHVLSRSLPTLKNRNYNTFMCEEIQGAGGTLDAVLEKSKIQAKRMQDLYEAAPEIMVPMSERYTLTGEEFLVACLEELRKNPYINPDKILSLPAKLLRHDPGRLRFYEILKGLDFAFKNLDENYSGSFPNTSSEYRQYLDTRDEQYIHEIVNAYHQKQGVIAVLGAMHLVPVPEACPSSSAFYNFNREKRKVICEKLDEQGVPYIGLFPFDSNHTPSSFLTKMWRKQTLIAHQTPDPSTVYSIDIAGEQGVKNFLQTIEILTAARTLDMQNDSIKNRRMR